MKYFDAIQCCFCLEEVALKTPKKFKKMKFHWRLKGASVTLSMSNKPTPECIDFACVNCGRTVRMLYAKMAYK